MKGSNVATVIMVAVASTVVAALMVNALLGDPNDEKVIVSYMDVVSSDVAEPDEEVFNINAVNPTVEVYVGNCNANERWDDDEQRCVEDKPEESADSETDETEE